MSGSPLDQPYRGGFIGREHHFALTTYYEDTDAAGIVYYANYLKFMERARSDMLRAIGVDQNVELRESGSAYAVVEVAIRYRRPAQLGDALVIVTTLEEVRSASLVIQQRVMRGPEEITTATVTAAFISSDRRAQRQPQEWLDRFKSFTAKGNHDSSD